MARYANHVVSYSWLKKSHPFPPFFYAKLHLMRSEKTLDFSLQRVTYLCFVSKPITQSIHDTEREVMCYLFNQKLPHPMLLPLSWMLPPKEKKWSNVPCTDHLLQHQSFQGIFLSPKWIAWKAAFLVDKSFRAYTHFHPVSYGQKWQQHCKPHISAIFFKNFQH